MIHGLLYHKICKNVSNATKVAFFVRIPTLARVREFGVQNHTHFVDFRTFVSYNYFLPMNSNIFPKVPKKQPSIHILYTSESLQVGAFAHAS